MSNRPNSIRTSQVAEALHAPALFTDLRDYFGSPEEDAVCRTFECAMEFDPSKGRLELHLFAAWQDGDDEPLLHLIARCQPNGTVTPAVVTLDGTAYNARHLSAGLFTSLLEFIGETRLACGHELYRQHHVRFTESIKPALLAGLSTRRAGFTDPHSIFHWGEIGILSEA